MGHILKECEATKGEEQVEEVLREDGAGNGRLRKIDEKRNEKDMAT